MSLEAWAAPSPTQFHCPGCYGDLPMDWAATLRCGHLVCAVCLDTHTRTSIEKRRFPLSCFRCNTEISVDMITTPQLRQVYLDTLSTWRKSGDPNLRPCIMTNCEGFRRRDVDSQCDLCGVSYCIKCGDRPTSHHYHLRSTPSRKRKMEDPVFVTRTLSCPTCGHGVERSAGCDHMTCSRCRHDFCWRCGLPGYGHPPNCGEKK